MYSSQLSTYDLATDWTGGPYGDTDSAGIVATSGNTTGVMTDGGPVGGPTAKGRGSNLPQGNPLVGLAIAFVAVVLIMWLTHHFAKADEDFKNIRASIWNVFVIALCAWAGIPLLKLGTGALATTNLPGTAALNTYSQAA